MEPNQKVIITNNSSAPEEDYFKGETGVVANPAFSSNGFLRVHLDNKEEFERLPNGNPYLFHAENVETYTPIIVRKTEEDSELYYKYPAQHDRQPAYLSIDLTEGTLGFDINYETNGTPGDVYNGLRLWFGPVPSYRTDAANELLEKVQELAQKLLDNLDDWNLYQRPHVEWKDDGEYHDKYNAIENIVEEFAFSRDNCDDCWIPYEFSTYYEPTSLEDIGLSSKSTPEDIKRVAKEQHEEAEYPLEGDEDGLEEYLTEWVENERKKEGDEDDDD